MIVEYKLREEVLAITHLWPAIVVVFLLGCLLGWGVSYLLPSPYRAQELLSVAYAGDAIYRNPDDYKNWYMEQLNTLTISTSVLKETLHRLRKQDAYWNNISAGELKRMLEVNWRNTGVWQFVVNANSAQHAEQALQAWVEVFFAQYQQAYSAATEFAILDKKLSNINRMQTELLIKEGQLAEIKQALQVWRTENLSGEVNKPLDLAIRWQLNSVAARAAGYDPAWETLLEQFPDANSPASAYAVWLDQLDYSLEAEIDDLPDQVNKLEQERNANGERYAAVAKASRGLSISLIVTRLSEEVPQAHILRPTSQMALVGGGVALVAGILIWLAQRGNPRKIKTHPGRNSNSVGNTNSVA